MKRSARGVIRIATRPSPLALVQARSVAALLGRPSELVPVSTRGDDSPDTPMELLAGAGVFVKEVQAAVIDGRADIAVHSAKDLVPVPTPGLAIAAFPVRDDVRDVLVGSSLEALGHGATVATGSVRRRAQLARIRPDLAFIGLRGNIATRLERVPPDGAIVMAHCALSRLGLDARIAYAFPVDVMLPQVGQGSLAVECREDDEELSETLASLDDVATRRAVEAERAYLARLGGACDLPVGALGAVETAARGGEVSLEVMAATADGAVLVRRSARGSDPVELGRRLAEVMLGEPEIAEHLR